MKQYISTEDIQEYCNKMNIKLESLFQTTSADNEVIPIIFHHFTGTTINKDELIIDIDSDHNQTYQCSIDLGEEQEGLEGIQNIEELSETISNMNQAKALAISNTLNERDFFYSHLSEQIANEFKNIELKKLSETERKEELNFLNNMEIIQDNKLEL